MKYTKRDIEEFHKQGFMILREFIPEKMIEACLEEIRFAFQDQAIKFGISDADSYDLDDLIKRVMNQEQDKRSFVYDHVKHIRAGRKIEFSDHLDRLFLDLGFQKPICFESPSLRFDYPGEEKYLTKAHQDLRSIRTPKCLTIWIPLSQCDEEHGSINVYPGSFENGIIEHIIEEKHIKVGEQKLKKYESLVVKAKPGDLVAMNSFCVHESYPNSSNKVKINLQFFYNDLALMNLNDKYDQLKKVPDYKEL